MDATDGHGLQNAVFKLYEGTDAEKSKFLGDFQTNENGVVVVQKLESGKYYTIVEAQPPHGYFLDAEHSSTPWENIFSKGRSFRRISRNRSIG